MRPSTSAKEPKRAGGSRSKRGRIPTAAAHHRTESAPRALAVRLGRPVPAGKVARFTISDARNNLSELVRRAANGEAPVAIGKQGEEEAILVSFAKFEALARQSVDPSNDAEMRQRLAEMIARRLLPDAPQHIVEPQVKELAALTLDDLALFVPVTGFPLSSDHRANVLAVRDGETLRRLEKRRDIAQAIAQATTEGLYETIEHRTNEAGVWSDDDAGHGESEPVHRG